MANSSSSRPSSEELTKYFDNRATLAERWAIERWADADSPNRAWLDRRHAAWKLLAVVEADDRDRAARGLSAATLSAAPVRETLRVRPLRLWPSDRHRLPSMATMRFAATIVFVLAGSVMLYVGTSRFRAAKSTVVWHYAAERGQFTNVQLPDGSQVALAPDSRLTFTEIGRSDRRVILEGRAVFSVHHDAQRRFIVAAGRAETEDVGTLFAVDAYPKEDDVHVAVREGQVAVRSVSARDSGGALLSAGDIVRMDATGTVQRLSGEDVPDYFEWTKHVERLHGQTLEQVLREVNRWYGADVRVIDSKLRAHPLTVTIDANVPLQQLLVTIAAATGARVESRGASNILTPKVP